MDRTRKQDTGRRVLPLLSVAALVLVIAGVPLAADDGAETISVDEIHRGQTGYGISVFTGTEPERFEVEVLGVLRHPTAGANAIVTRLRGRNLEETGVIAGMSGSPVYIEGRLAGAVAFSWSFSTGAVAGITPIGEMRAVGEASPPAGAAGTAATASFPIPLADLLARKPADDLLSRSLEVLAGLGGSGSALGDGVRSTVQWSLGGFGETSRRLLTNALGDRIGAGSLGAAASLTGGEAGGVDYDLALKPGAPVSAVLVQGDLRLAAGGTVTDRQGDRVLAFGHPFLGLGPINVPMAAAEVITVVPSLSNSFKLSNMGPIVGAFQEDRRAALFGRMGAEAPTLPLSVRVEGRGLGFERTYRMQLARLPSLVPTLVAISVLGALDDNGHAGGEQGLDFKLKIRLKDYGEVDLAQSFDSANAVSEAAIFSLTMVGALSGTTFQQVELEEVEVEVRRFPQPRTTSIVRAFTPRTTVRPGETIPLFVEMKPYRGKTQRRRLEVPLPADLKEGPYFLMVADGATADVARQAITPAPPATLPQLLDFVRSVSSNRELHVLGLVGAPGLVVGGQALPQLPGSVRADRTVALPTDAQAIPLAVVQELRETLEVPLSGVVRVDLTVERSLP